MSREAVVKRSSRQTSYTSTSRNASASERPTPRSIASTRRPRIPVRATTDASDSPTRPRAWAKARPRATRLRGGWLRLDRRRPGATAPTTSSQTVRSRTRPSRCKSHRVGSRIPPSHRLMTEWRRSIRRASVLWETPASIRASCILPPTVGGYPTCQSEGVVGSGDRRPATDIPGIAPQSRPARAESAPTVPNERSQAVRSRRVQLSRPMILRYPAGKGSGSATTPLENGPGGHELARAQQRVLQRCGSQSETRNASAGDREAPALKLDHWRPAWMLKGGCTPAEAASGRRLPGPLRPRRLAASPDRGRRAPASPARRLALTEGRTRTLPFPAPDGGSRSPKRA